MSETHDTSGRRMYWAGWALSALAALGLFMSAGMKLTSQPQMLEMFVKKFGYPEGSQITIGLVEALCAVIYLVPQSSVLGAILLTGYLGGAVATHVRVQDPFISPIILGAVIWLGLYLRDGRLRDLLPLRRSISHATPAGPT